MPKIIRPIQKRGGQPYHQEEIDLILSNIPTFPNIKRLAKVLGRTEAAIHVIYEQAYSGEWLKGRAESFEEDQKNVVTKIVKAKKKLKITIGYIG